MGGGTATSASGRPAPRFQRLSRDERRDQILAVARRMFTELPYAEVSTEAIASAAGVRRGLIHYYFRTKRELFLEVVRELTTRVAYAVQPPPKGLSLAETVEWCVERFLDAAEANATTWFAAVDAVSRFLDHPQLPDQCHLYLRLLGGVYPQLVERVPYVLAVF